MNRLFLIIFTIALATGCSGSGGGRYAEDYEPDYSANEQAADERDERIAELEAQVEEARSNAEDLQNAQDELRSASADLQYNVDRLQSENWRDVVPDIEQSSSDVDYAQENSESASQDVADTLEEQ